MLGISRWKRLSESWRRLMTNSQPPAKHPTLARRRWYVRWKWGFASTPRAGSSDRGFAWSHRVSLQETVYPASLIVGSQRLKGRLRLLRGPSGIGASAGSAEGGGGQQGQNEAVRLGARHVRSLSEWRNAW